MINDKKKKFIKVLAKFLVDDAVRKGIGLKLGKQSSIEWAAVYSASGLPGWATVDQAEKHLARFLEDKL
jgi:hypothetical protein